MMTQTKIKPKDSYHEFCEMFFILSLLLAHSPCNLQLSSMQSFFNVELSTYICTLCLFLKAVGVVILISNGKQK